MYVLQVLVEKSLSLRLGHRQIQNVNTGWQTKKKIFAAKHLVALVVMRVHVGREREGLTAVVLKQLSKLCSLVIQAPLLASLRKRILLVKRANLARLTKLQVKPYAVARSAGSATQRRASLWHLRNVANPILLAVPAPSLDLRALVERVHAISSVQIKSGMVSRAPSKV
jgi:hypothetical protein